MTRREQMLWDIVFANVLGIRLHPRNALNVETAIATASQAANAAIDERRHQCPSASAE